jgi:hypothetical protein
LKGSLATLGWNADGEMRLDEAVKSAAGNVATNDTGRRF